MFLIYVFWVRLHNFHGNHSFFTDLSDTLARCPILYCDKLRTFVANRQIQNKCVKQLLSTCSYLKILNLNENPFLTEKTFHQLISFSIDTSIESLSLAYASFIDDDAVYKIINKLKNLRVLNITGTAIKEPKIASNLLQQLYMNDCEFLVYEAIVGSVIGCAKLKTIELINCKRLYSADLVRLKREYPNVEVLF